MRLSILASALTLVFTLGGYGQQAMVSGTISADGKPVAGARVVLREANARIVYSAIAANDGKFFVSDVQSGEYYVEASSEIAGVRFTVRESVSVGSAPTELRLTLSPLPMIREQVTIAAGEVETIESTAKTVTSIGGQEMRDRADFSLVDTLRSVPGLRVAQSGGFGRVASIKTRGLRNQDTALLIDGIRVRDAASIVGDATPFLSDITLTSVSKLEILRGSGSSLYGTNAIGGVIDLQTPSARDGTHGQVSLAAGGLGLTRFRGNLSHGASEKFGVVGALSRTVYSKGVDGDDAAHNTNIQARVDALAASRLRISGRVFYSDADVKLNSEPDTISPPSSNRFVVTARSGVNFFPDRNDPDWRQDSRAFSGQLTASWAPSPTMSLRGYFQRADITRTNSNGPLGFGFQNESTTVLDGTVDTANAALAWGASDKLSLNAGYEFESETFENFGKTPDGLGDFSTHAAQRSHTGFAQGILTLAENRLRIAGGLRFQTFDLARPSFSPVGSAFSGVTLENPPISRTLDGAVSYLFRRTGTKLRAHVGNGYRVPSLYERFGTFYSTFPSGQFIALGDPSLKPERSIAADVGLDQEILRGNILISATYFYTNLTDIIGFGSTVRPIGGIVRPFGGYENQRGGISRGAELSVRGRTRFGLDLFAAYTFTNSDQRTPQIAGSETLQTLGVPVHQVSVVTTQRIGRFWISLDLLAASSSLGPVFSSTTFNSYVYRFAGNRRADLTAGYTLPLPGRSRNLRLFATIENLLDQEYFENGFRTPGVNGRFGVAFSF